MRDFNDEYCELLKRMEQILAELDQLGLGNVAVHIDLAIRRLEAIIVGDATTLGGIRAN